MLNDSSRRVQDATGTGNAHGAPNHSAMGLARMAAWNLVRRRSPNATSHPMAKHSPLHRKLLCRMRVNRETGCWEWHGYCDPDGYARIMRGPGKGKCLLLHRLMFEHRHGALPGGMKVCHHCDNPRCFKPDHLFLGTQGQNVADKMTKGRQARGAGHGCAKLSEEQAREALHSDESWSGLARRMGVTKAAIGRLKRRKTWKHLSEMPAAKEFAA